MTELLSIVLTWFMKGAAVGAGATLGVVIMSRFFPVIINMKVGDLKIRHEA